MRAKPRGHHELHSLNPDPIFRAYHSAAAHCVETCPHRLRFDVTLQGDSTFAKSTARNLQAAWYVNGPTGCLTVLRVPHQQK